MKDHYIRLAENFYPGKFDGSYQNNLNPKKKEIVWDFIMKIKPKVVVDIGCNRGELSYELKKYGIRVIGIDISSPQELGVPDDYEFIQMDVVKEDFNIEADVILFLSVYHHIVYSYDLQTADKVFMKLFNRTKYLIFDFGNPEETGIYRQGWISKLRKHFKTEKELLDHFGIPYKVLGTWETGFGKRTIVYFENKGFKF